MRAGASDSLMTFLGSCLLTALLFAGRYILDQRDGHRPPVRIETSERSQRDPDDVPLPDLRPVDETVLKSPWPDFEETPEDLTGAPIDPVSVTAEIPQKPALQRPRT